MKIGKGLSLVLSVLMLFGMLMPSMTAKEADIAAVSTETEQLANGDYIETVLVTYAQSDGAKASTVNGQKTKSYKNSSGVVMWSVTVYGTFSYTGSSATCTSASRNTTCPGSGWSIVASSASKSGNTAKATATARYNNGNYSLSVTLKCNADGVLS